MLSNIIQSLNRNILTLLLAVFCIAIFVFGVSCTDFSDKKEVKSVGDEKFPDMEIHTFFREMFVGDIKSMDVFATNAKMYTANNEVELYSTYGLLYENDIVTSSMKADKAIIDEDTLYTKLYSNVILITSNNTKLYTDYIEWDNNKRYFTTKEPVRIVQPDGSWLTGVGMEGDMNLENITVYNEEDEGYSDSVPATE